MAAVFREVLPYSGFDDSTPTGGPGIVVPLKSSNVVMLEGGRDLKLVTVMKPMLDLDDIKDDKYYQSMLQMQHVTDQYDRMVDLVSLKSGDLRVIKITGNNYVPLGKARIDAVNPRTKKAEASLKVIVLKQKPVTIAIRPVQVRNERGELVNSSTVSIDPELLKQQMNYIWKWQANVVFDLSKTVSVPIDGLRPESAADIQDRDLKRAFLTNKDGDANLTFFMVKQALDKRKPVAGVTDPEAGYSLISDDRSDSTMAHEAGHYLGSVTDSGKFSMSYGHQGTDADLLMRDGGAGHKIPFSLVTDFNKRYRA